MALFSHDQVKAEIARKEEAERLRRIKLQEEKQRMAEEEERKRAIEDAERKRLAEEAKQQRAIAEEAERKRLAEEAERQRVAAEEAEKQRIAEEAERQRAAEEAEIQRRKEKFSPFAKHSHINFDAFAREDYQCNYDSMNFIADIMPQEQYLDVSYKNEEDENDNEALIHNDEKELDPDYQIAVDIRMLYSNGICQYLPRIIFSVSYYVSIYDSAKDIIVKIGENRYRITPPVIHKTKETEYGYTTETARMTIPFGPKDLEVLKYLASGKHEVIVKIGEMEAPRSFTEADFDFINKFINACETAGIFDQNCFRESENVFVPFTLFNED